MSKIPPGSIPGLSTVTSDHDTGKVRALLCRGCNVALGLLREDPAAIRALANYIETHRTAPCA